jgi:hypothetical protein
MDGSTRILEIAKPGRKADDLTGRVFGFLRPIARVEQLTDKRRRQVWWLCYCFECGGFCCAMRSSLVDGKQIQCGCLHYERDVIPDRHLAYAEHRGRLYRAAPKKRRHRLLRLRKP